MGRVGLEAGPGAVMNLTRLFVVLYWVWLALEIGLQVVTRTSRRSGTVRDRGSLPLLLATIVGASWTAARCAHLRAFAMPDGWHGQREAALICMVAGLGIRWAAVFTLGFSFSTNVAIHATQRLRRTGLFRWVRHPSYSGLLLILVAIGLVERSWLSLGIMLVFPLAALLYRMHVEEAALTAAFGAEYVEYIRTTRRLVPGIY
jgi:protein-S-isoprenylcysteine O-methyltransferase Ste14